MNQELHQLQIIKDFAVSLLRQNSLEDLLWDMARNIGELLNYEDCIIYLNINGAMEQCAAYGVKNPNCREIIGRIRIPLGEGIVGTVGMTGKAELVSNTADDPRYIPDVFCGQSELAVPIVSEGKVIGVIDSESQSPDSYDNDDLEILQAIANIAASRIAAAMSQQEVIRISGEGAKYKLLLKNEREWSRTVLNSMQEGIIATNRQSDIVMTGLAAESLTGWSSEDARGRPLTEVFAIDDSLTLEDLPLEKSADGEAEMQVRNGATRKIAYRVSPIRYDDALVGRLVVFRDIEREQFLEREAEKAQRIESLGVLAGGIAHDFNNNIQSVLSSLQALSLVTDESCSRMIRTAEQACMQSKELARQLLTFSKGGAPVMSPTGTSELIRESVDLAMAGRTSSVRYEMDADLLNICVDRIQIEQVIGNVLINADQAMPDGGEITVSVQDSFMPSNPFIECVEISIKDHGCGISEAKLNRIFDPYFSTKTAGHGLGLTISYSIVKRHGGEIVVRSEEGIGTTFQIFLPATRSNPVRPVAGKTCVPSGGLRILLLDDDKLVLQTTEALLTHHGHHVVAVANREQAVTAFRDRFDSREPFDLAILDLTIRGDVGGQEIGRQLRLIDPDLRMIVSSGYTTGPVLTNYRDYGFCGVLEKPFDGSRLADAVQKASGIKLRPR